MNTKTSTKQIEIYFLSRFILAVSSVRKPEFKPDHLSRNRLLDANQPGFTQDIGYSFMGLVIGLTAGYLLAWIIFGV